MDSTPGDQDVTGMDPFADPEAAATMDDATSAFASTIEELNLNSTAYTKPPPVPWRA